MVISRRPLGGAWTGARGFSAHGSGDEISLRREQLEKRICITADTPRCFCSLLQLVRESGQIEGGELTGMPGPLEEEGPLRGRRDLIAVINRCDDWSRGVRAGEQAVGQPTERTAYTFAPDFLRSTPPTTADGNRESSPRG